MKSYDNKYPLDYYNELEKKEIDIYKIRNEMVETRGRNT